MVTGTGEETGDMHFRGLAEWKTAVSWASSTVSEIKLECHFEMSGDERIFIEAC